MSKVQLNWTDPTTYTDGSPLTVVNVEIFGGLVGQPQGLLGNVGPGVGSFLTPDLDPGQYAFNVVVQDGSTPQRSSDPSNTATVTIEATVPNPSAVNNLTATVVPDSPPSS